MAIATLYFEIASQDFFNGLGFCRRLNNQQILRHTSLLDGIFYKNPEASLQQE
jgi:hypothetical protein